eukprot:TRINITY_DN29592_c0_g1_i1.p1 TRINITY_DN29592_c0_g1~~TRINITY_DN29592_c0_g1_i1.p1  ORF type:complete len:306 (+),score=56.15 TRINITY_DN29592_c0_g1_i1:52-918(+)
MPFVKTLKANSGVMMAKMNIDRGGKVNLPHSCMGELARMEITYPMMFKISNPVTGKSSHCGVLEFTADEGCVVVPYWMLQLLGVGESERVVVESVTLPRGTFMKIQPVEEAFIRLSNPKVVLESRLNNFSCLTKGDTILINYNDRNYEIIILEVKVGDREVNAISIVETDVKVDFSRPLNMPPSPETKPLPKPTAAPSSSSGLHFGNTLMDRGDPDTKAPPAPSTEIPTTGFRAFTGVGRSLGGASGPSSGSGPSQPVRTDSYGRPLKTEEPKQNFVAFSGKGRSLTD